MVFLRTHQPYSGTGVLMETKLERIAEISASSPRPEFTSLYHLINKEMTEKSKRLAVLEGLLNMNDKDIVTDTEPEQQCQTDNRQRGQEER